MKLAFSIKDVEKGRGKWGGAAGGFTMLELLIALALVSISFMAIIPLLWNTLVINKTTDMGGKAKEMAVQKIEDLMSMPRDVFDAAPFELAKNSSYTSEVEYLTEKGVVSKATDPAAIYRRTFDIRQVPGVAEDPKPVILTSVVQYTYKGTVRSRSFSTMWSF